VCVVSFSIHRGEALCPSSCSESQVRVSVVPESKELGQQENQSLAEMG